MSKLKFAALTFLVIAAVGAALCPPAFVAESQKPAAPSRPGDLPPGPMQEAARNACTICHDAGIIVQQRLSKEAWGREVDKMVRWGTVLDPKDRDPLIDYLSTNFPPDKRPDPPARVGAGK